MNLTEVKALDKIATADGYETVDYRPYSYEQYGSLHRVYALIMMQGGEEVAVFSLANYDSHNFTHIFN